MKQSREYYFTYEAFKYRCFLCCYRSLKKNRTRMLNLLSILEKMHPDNINVFLSNIIDKYKNRPDNLHSMCLM